jgi:two-component system CheB/CheR fusion protein
MIKSITPFFHLQTTMDFPLVAIGASAGGLQALQQFFKHMPINSNMIFVVVSHLSPIYKSLLPELLQQHTAMKVIHITNGMKLQANQVYIIPPSVTLTLAQGVFQLTPQKEPRSIELPIDTFFTSLAQHWHKLIIGIILSGTGSDGTSGLKAIKAAGGCIIAQSPASSEYDGMPRSAINTGLVDAILPPEEMPRQLLKYTKQAIIKTAPPPEPLHYIYLLLLNRSGHDFSCYKQKTIHRRIQRRMLTYSINNFEDYMHYLRQNPLELDNLFKEFLIGVTQFFRDASAFEALKKQLLLKFSNNEISDDGLRIWIPGCSHGEEVYSIAMLLQECMETLSCNIPIKIFATDIDQAAINQARQAVYSVNAVAHITPERLQKFFIKEKSNYRIKSNVREMVIFAYHSIIKDPPFAKLDLISCRNLLIYFNTELQKKVLPLFYFCLKQKGLLMLGISETIGGFVDLFSSIDRKWKIFAKREILLSRQPIIQFPLLASKTKMAKILTKEQTMKDQSFDISPLVDRFLLNNFAPACVIVNETGDILYVHGKTGLYLELAPGKAHYNVLEMSCIDMKTELTSAFHQAIIQNKEVVVPKLTIKANGNSQIINLKIKPLLDLEKLSGLLAIIFETLNLDTIIVNDENKLSPTRKGSKQITTLQQALKETKETLQVTIEEHKSSNEELQSINEELQSNNEELETSKEELQSLNEELITVNSELQSKIEQLSSINDDMKNFLDSTEVATLFLDDNLCIKRFTPKVTQLINLIPLDIGRPIVDFFFKLKYTQLIEDVYEVLKTKKPKSLQVMTKEGQWYCIRIMPYRTTANIIDGIVITFLNIHSQKQTEEKLEQLNNQLHDALDYSDNIIATLTEPFLVLNGDLKIISANHAYYQMFQTVPANTEGHLFYKVNKQQWNIPSLKELLEQIITQNNFFNGFEVIHTFPHVGAKKLLLNARRISRQDTDVHLILLAIKDVTKHLDVKENA